MLIVVDPHSGVPVYRQLMDQIKLHIAGGLLKPGDELPSTRALSSELGVNPMTISKAYSFLEMENIIERRPGRPLVVRDFDTRGIRDKKIDQLRRSLEQTVTVVKQLGIEREEALGIFGAMLEKEAGDMPGDRGNAGMTENEPEGSSCDRAKGEIPGGRIEAPSGDRGEEKNTDDETEDDNDDNWEVE